jgi:hypothetical protein
MFYFISGVTPSSAVAPRRIYDNPPVLDSAPRWARLDRLAAAVGARAPLGRTQVRATSPVPACGSPSC